MHLEQLGLTFVPAPYVNPLQFKDMEDWLATTAAFKYLWTAQPNTGLGLVVRQQFRAQAEQALREALAYALGRRSAL